MSGIEWLKEHEGRILHGIETSRNIIRNYEKELEIVQGLIRQAEKQSLEPDEIEEAVERFMNHGISSETAYDSKERSIHE